MRSYSDVCIKLASSNGFTGKRKRVKAKVALNTILLKRLWRTAAKQILKNPLRFFGQATKQPWNKFETGKTQKILATLRNVNITFQFLVIYMKPVLAEIFRLFKAKFVSPILMLISGVTLKKPINGKKLFSVETSECCPK